jgi:hypothetical protein
MKFTTYKLKNFNYVHSLYPASLPLETLVALVHWPSLTEGWRGEEFGLSAFLNRDFLFKDCECEGLSPWVDSSESLSCMDKGIDQTT